MLNNECSTSVVQFPQRDAKLEKTPYSPVSLLSVNYRTALGAGITDLHTNRSNFQETLGLEGNYRYILTPYQRG